MLTTIKWMGKAIGAGIAAVLVLSAFCLLCGYSGAHIDNPSGATDYKWQANALRTTMGEGFSWLRMDDDGFNNQWRPMQDSVDVLLMGSSHEEAVNVGATQSTAYVLNSLLQSSGAYCYSVAMSGHTICHNVKNLADAVRQYKPASCVVIETSTVNPSEVDMLSVVNGTFPKIPSYDSGILFTLQKIPAMKPIFKNIESLTVSAPVLEDGNDGSPQAADSAAYAATLRAFLEKAKADAGDVRVIMIYHPTLKIQEDGTVTPVEDAEKASAFSLACRDAGIEFIDMTAPFIAHYSESWELPHGFSNTHVGTGHLNAAGHKLMADAIFQALALQEVSQ